MTPLLTTEIKLEHDVVLARQRARQIAELLGFDAQDQSRVATAVSEIARNAFVYAHGGRVEFGVDSAPPGALRIRISDRGGGIPDLDAVLSGRYQSPTGMGLGLIGCKRLMDRCDIKSEPGVGTEVLLIKQRPRSAAPLGRADIDAVATKLLEAPPESPFQELRQQNQELLRTLEELRRREAELEQLNTELEETNRGVLALYTELDDKAEQLQRSADTKTRFLSHVSHEVRTPINAILSLSELLEGQAEDGRLSSDQQKTISFIRKSALQLSELVNDLLDLAKVEAGRVEVHPRTFSLADLFGALRGMFRVLSTSEQVSLIVDEPADVPELFTDDAKLSQILRNLISNALKFTERGKVQVTARLERDRVVIAVQDTGIGIAPADQARLFQEFSQLQNPIQQRVRGTGLGLAISKALAELLGGTIEVQSAVGVGSTFTVSLPRVYASAAVRPEPTPAPSEPSTTPSALIVDDDEIARFILKGLLPPGRYRYLDAADGEEGLRLAQQQRPELIFLDLRMPRLDGYEFLRRIDEDPALRDVPVIVHTMQRLSDEERRALGEHVVAVVPKQARSRDESVQRLAEALARAEAKQSRSARHD